MKTKQEQYQIIISGVRTLRSKIEDEALGAFNVQAHYAHPRWSTLARILKQCSNDLADWLKENEDAEDI